MADIIYTPQFQPPVWQDNVDLVSAQGPIGYVYPNVNGTIGVWLLQPDGVDASSFMISKA